MPEGEQGWMHKFDLVTVSTDKVGNMRMTHEDNL